MHPIISILVLVLHSAFCLRYDPNWGSLDSRPLPAWYDEGKVGIFLHWGVFSVPAFGSEWFWWNWQGQHLPAYTAYMQENYRPDFTYADFAPMFHAEFYNPDQWADIFQASGANYLVLVSKHHEGFTNWPSNYSWNWNAGDVGPKRDLVGDLADAIRKKTSIKFGVYHSMFEWFNPLFQRDQANGFTTQDFVRAKTMPELYELVNRYQPEIVWSDGEWMAADTYWNSTEFIAWLYNDSPVKDTVVVNDRWGNNTRCAHGGFWDCSDHYTPGTLVPHKWENCMSLDRYSWGFRANARLQDIYTIEECLAQLVTTVRYTARTNGSTTVYAILLSWPEGGNLTLGYPVASPTSTVVTLIGYPGQFEFLIPSTGGITIKIPPIPAGQIPCDWAWVFRLDGLKNQKTKLNSLAFSKNLKALQMKNEVPIFK